ncbi:Major Facilitator Superfamily protein [Paraoerskovia marina]|uniref:Major Facilitator Superfamily protein n=1 Tax=Paraoerskovia marina TaxID=545619 RepID=A0A1H1P2A9_9CELL|nr:MFS transporter [Paraoerskovia marina]SDS05388.1 Major Facilitator Superfamily protein [Paraoerskovia marina]
MVQNPPDAPDTPGAPSLPPRRTNPYAAVLRTPGAAKFSAAAVLARLPMSMLGIGTVLMVESLYDSYALAGRVSATLILAQALVSPQVARIVDRHGQRRVMLPLIFLAALGLGGLIVTGIMRGPEPLLYLTAAVAGGASGSFGSFVRARWSYVLTDPKTLHTAYSLESALDEFVFVVGPAVVTILATTVAPPAGLVVPLVAAFAGGWWFLSQRSTEPPPVPPVEGVRTTSAMRQSGMVPLVLVFIAMGTVLGGVDVATIAFAEEQGVPGMAGIVLAIFALGSLTSGLAYGAKHWVSPLWRRFVIGVVLLAVGTSLFSFAHTLPALAAIMFVAGFAIAPTLINGNALVQNLVRPSQLTEGLAWVGTSLGIGVSIGASLTGARVDVGGAAAGFHVVMAGGAVSVIVTLISVRSLRKDRSTEQIRTA